MPRQYFKSDFFLNGMCYKLGAYTTQSSFFQVALTKSFMFVRVAKKYRTLVFYMNNKDMLNSLNKTQWDVKSCEEQFRLKARHTHTIYESVKHLPITKHVCVCKLRFSTAQNVVDSH